MCGIIGYTGKDSNAKFTVINCLKNLEYRGYDSAGVALTANDNIQIYKSIGKLKNLEENLNKIDIKSNTGIGHTRWATHGKPNENNAHPHKYGSVTLVHNGIIENYNELKKDLDKNGIELKSDTDTEVACAYIDYIYKNTSSNDKHLFSIINACNNFKGSYAFGIIFDDKPDTIYATRKDSPLIIGKGKDFNFIASDVSAILEYTKDYILLEYGEFAKITNDNIEIYDKELNIIQKQVNTASWDATEYKKEGFEHYMLKEIHEQPKVIKDIFNRYMEDNSLGVNLDFSKFKQIHIVACGSAMHAGLIGKYLFEDKVNIPVTVEVASEYRYKNQLITPDTLVIIISQSGETADSLAALRIAKENKATILAIVNVFGSTIAREADNVIYTQAGPEIAVATTKGYTSQVAILSLICLNIMKQKQIIEDYEEKQIENEFYNIEDTLNKLINMEDIYTKTSQAIYKSNDLFYIGRGIDYPLCMEGSLKLKEISYMHSEAYAAGELKHGTISLIENNTPIIAIATNPKLYEKTISNIKETKARGAFVIFISTCQECKNDFADINISIENQSSFTISLSIACIMQLIAYHTAKLRGCDIDKPKNLAKSVTVE